MNKPKQELWKRPQPRRESNYPTEQETSDASLQQARIKLLMVPQGSQFRNARARAITDLAVIYWRRLQFDEAISLWKQLVEMAHQSNDHQELGMVYATLATTYSQKGDYRPAIDYAKKALIYDIENPIVMLMLGGAYDGAGDDTNALLWWRRLLKAHPDFQNTYESLGSLHFRRGEFAEAERNLLRALEIEPDSDVGINELGNMYITMGRFNEALVRFQDAQRYWPKSASAYNNIGNCYMKMGRYAEAIRAYEKRIEMRPKDALSAYLSLAAILRLQPDEKSLERSNKHFQRAAEIHHTGQAQLLSRRIEHDVRGALALIGLDDEGVVEVWRTVLANPAIERVGVGPVADWRFFIKLLQQSPHPLKHIDEVAKVLAEKYDR